MTRTKAANMEKMKRGERAQAKEDIKYLCKKICPWRKCLCEQMRNGNLILNKKKVQKIMEED